MNKPRKKIITDLDASDSQIEVEIRPYDDSNQQRKIPHRKREKTIQTLSGNFNRRSRSVECHVGPKTDIKKSDLMPKKVQMSLQEVLLSKERQLEQLVQKMATIHKYNERFAEENDNLKKEIESLDTTVVNLQKCLADCPNCQKLKKHVKNEIDEKKFLSNDIEMLKTLVFRLNVQIENYQDRLRDLGSKETTANQKNSSKKTKISKWTGKSHVHTLRPLLEAYDEMIKEKDELIAQYRSEFEDFSARFKDILEENNLKHQQLEKMKKEFSAWQEEKVRLQAQLNVCRGKAEYHAQKTDLAKEKLVEVMECYEQKNQTLQLELDHIQTAYVRCKNELASLKGLQNMPKENITTSLNDCKKLLKDLTEQHSKEKLAFEQTNHELNKKIEEHELELQKLRFENQSLKGSFNKENNKNEEMKERLSHMVKYNERCKRSRDRLKARLRIALQWAQKLEQGQDNIQSTWDALKRLETIVKHKESQVRGLHERHLIEIGKMEKKLLQKEETIKAILKSQISKTLPDKP